MLDLEDFRQIGGTMFRRMLLGTSHRCFQPVGKQHALGAESAEVVGTAKQVQVPPTPQLRKPDQGMIVAVVARVCGRCYYSRQIERFDRALKVYAAEKEGYYDHHVLEEHLRGEFKRYLEDLLAFSPARSATSIKTKRLRLPYLVKDKRLVMAQKIAQLEEQLSQYKAQMEFQAKHGLDAWVEERVTFLIREIEHHIVFLAESAAPVNRSHPRGYIIRKCILSKKRRYTYLIVDEEYGLKVKSVMSSRNFNRWCRTRFTRKELAKRNEKRDREARDYRNLPAQCR